MNKEMSEQLGLSFVKIVLRYFRLQTVEDINSIYSL